MATTAMAVDDNRDESNTELEESEEELDDEDLKGYYFYKGFQLKKYVYCFKENMGAK